MLGVHTVILAASPNDNGLLHQELVDFALPDGLGWQARNASAPPPPAEQCVRLFGFAKADAAVGASAEQHRRQQQLRFWRGSGRFVQPSRPAPHGHARDAQAPPCELAFGAPGGDPAGAVGACTITPQDEESPPSASKACYMWCAGALSQSHAPASLFHTRLRGTPWTAGHRPTNAVDLRPATDIYK